MKTTYSVYSIEHTSTAFILTVQMLPENSKGTYISGGIPYFVCSIRICLRKKLNIFKNFSEFSLCIKGENLK